MNRLLLIACLHLFFFPTLAQTIPAENDTLNYRLVGFSVPSNPKAHTYLFEIAKGRINNRVDFQKNIIISQKDTGNRIIATVPAFGQEYTWRVNYLNKKGKVKGKTVLNHFTTGIIRSLDTNTCRLQIISPAEKHNELLVFLDNPAVLYNMEGEPLWYLPNIPGVSEDNRSVRDLKLNSSGTLTCITEKGIYEINYNGKILWSGPDDGKVSGDTTEKYHHQFNKLSNGHYMVPGDKNILVEITADTALITKDSEIIRKGDKFYRNTPLGTLIEYDSAGKVIWHWKSSDFFTKKEPIGSNFIRGQINTNIHMNGFYFNEKDSLIYISFKNISRVLKLKYPGGEVVANYHGKPAGSSEQNERSRGGRPGRPHNDLFSYQHNCGLTKDGRLLLFNNNMLGGMRGVSYVSMFEEPADNEGELKKVWEFSCDIDENTNAGAGVGGSAYMLDDGSVIACTGTAGRVFIVSPGKKILWNAVPEISAENTWRPLRQYKVSVIENKQALEKLIFH